MMPDLIVAVLIILALIIFCRDDGGYGFVRELVEVRVRCKNITEIKAVAAQKHPCTITNVTSTFAEIYSELSPSQTSYVPQNELV